MLRLTMKSGIAIRGTDGDLSFSLTWSARGPASKAMRFELIGVEPSDTIRIVRPGRIPQPIPMIGSSVGFATAKLHPGHAFEWIKADGRRYRMLGHSREGHSDLRPSVAFDVPRSCLIVRDDAISVIPFAARARIADPERRLA